MNIEGFLRQTNRANFDALYLFSKTYVNYVINDFFYKRNSSEEKTLS